MKKCGLIAGITMLAVLTACTQPNTVTETSTEKTTKAAETESETSESQSGNDYDSQLKLISEQYKNWNVFMLKWQEKPDENVDDNGRFKVAITDLNRNGRLELICTSNLGTGLFSQTVVYEVNESYTNLNRLASPKRDDGVDKGGDFMDRPVLNCYKLNGVYYYAVDDYTPSGASVIEESLYAYSFDGGINAERIGGYTLKIEDFDYDSMKAKSVLVKFSDANKGYLDDAEALDKLIEDYWKGYEKQPCVSIKWVDFPQEADCYEALKQSYEGYNENSSDTCDLLPNYKSFHGDTPEYKVMQRSK